MRGNLPLLLLVLSSGRGMFCNTTCFNLHLEFFLLIFPIDMFGLWLIILLLYS